MLLLGMKSDLRCHYVGQLDLSIINIPEWINQKTALTFMGAK